MYNPPKPPPRMHTRGAGRAPVPAVKLQIEFTSHDFAAWHATRSKSCRAAVSMHARRATSLHRGCSGVLMCIAPLAADAGPVLVAYCATTHPMPAPPMRLQFCRPVRLWVRRLNTLTSLTSSGARTKAGLLK